MVEEGEEGADGFRVGTCPAIIVNPSFNGEEGVRVPVQVAENVDTVLLEDFGRSMALVLVFCGLTKQADSLFIYLG